MSGGSESGSSQSYADLRMCRSAARHDLAFETAESARLLPASRSRQAHGKHH
jgi:hypothetical protein